MRNRHLAQNALKASDTIAEAVLPVELSPITCSRGAVQSQQHLEAAPQHSSEKSCQDGMSAGQHADLLNVSGLQSGGSSRGSFGAVGQGSSQPQEMQRCRSVGSTDVSSASLGHTSINTPSEVEDADVSSAPAYGQAHGALLGADDCRSSGAGNLPGGPELPNVAGDTAQDKAENARAMAEAAMKEAKAKARCAAEMMAVAQQKVVLESRSLKRKRSLGLKSYVGPPSHMLLGVRISVYWPDDDAFYKGRIVEVLDEDDRVLVKYDDEMDEELHLLCERFQWLAPRAQSAGASSQLHMEMARLGAEGVEETPQVPDTSDMGFKGAPEGAAAVGGRISIHFAGVGIWCRGEVLAYDASREKHHILYEDGENEWVRLSREAYTWCPNCAESAYPAGLPPGTAAPSGQEAIGWRVSIYWPDNSTFYVGEVIGFDNVTGRHHVLYDNGDQEHLALNAAKVCWVMPPSVSSQAARPEEALHQSAPKGMALGTDLAISGRSLRRSGSAGRAVRQAALLQEQAPSRFEAKAWLKEELAGQGDGELLPFDDDDDAMLDEGLCADDFPRGIAGEQLKGEMPTWWHEQLHSHSAAVLISGLEPRRVRSSQLPSLAEEDAAAWADVRGPAAARGGNYMLRTQRSLPDCTTIGTARIGLPLTRAMTMPTAGDCQLDDLICQLDAGAEGISMSSPVTVGLEESMDMALPGMDLPAMLLESSNPQQGSSLVASSSAPLVGGSAHGSVEIESQLSGLAAVGMRDFLSAGAPDVADVAQFLCGDEDAAAATEGGARQLVDSSTSLASLSSARGSALSMASDTSVVYIGAPSSQPLQPSMPGSPGLCGANTPESARRMLHWEMGRKSALGEPLQSPSSSAALARVPLAPEPLDTSVDLNLNAGSPDGLAMATELQTLLAEMDWG
ncbi:probable DNA mismatch repair protein MSH6 at C-terminar half [Coccomyxa sp. Obi]|nr:probable DNA mismatch repair protein MSH6 at C-terminar half [Coccomyxa sp. Obi]